MLKFHVDVDAEHEIKSFITQWCAHLEKPSPKCRIMLNNMLVLVQKFGQLDLQYSTDKSDIALSSSAFLV
jgi:hypothetical protein